MATRFGKPRFVWLNRLNSSPRSSKLIPSVRRVFFTNPRSKSLKPGATSWSRRSLPNVPIGCTTTAQGLYQCWLLWTVAGAIQVGFAATGPPTFGLPTRLGRSISVPLLKFARSKPSTMLYGVPECNWASTDASQPFTRRLLPCLGSWYTRFALPTCRVSKADGP